MNINTNMNDLKDEFIYMLLCDFQKLSKYIIIIIIIKINYYYLKLLLSSKYINTRRYYYQKILLKGDFFTFFIIKISIVNCQAIIQKGQRAHKYSE